VRSVVVNETINYHHPAKYGDVLDLICRVEEIGESSVRFSYRIVEHGIGKEIVRASTTVVAIDPEGKPARIPQEVREALNRVASPGTTDPLR